MSGANLTSVCFFSVFSILVIPMKLIVYVFTCPMFFGPFCESYVLDHLNHCVLYFFYYLDWTLVSWVWPCLCGTSRHGSRLSLGSPSPFPPVSSFFIPSPLFLCSLCSSLFPHGLASRHCEVQSTRQVLLPPSLPQVITPATHYLPIKHL